MGKNAARVGRNSYDCLGARRGRLREGKLKLTHFLYKPHVYGPENNVTTPDILIDKAYAAVGSGDAVQISRIAVSKLSSQVELEVDAGELSVTPAYILIALGGGILLSVGAQVHGKADGEASSTMLITRHAWRLRNVLDHAGTLELAVLEGPVTNARPLGKISVNEMPKPAEVVGRVSYDAEALPRGTMVFCPASKLSQTVGVPTSLEMILEDKKLKRKLAYRPNIVTAESDSWEERPLPRYEVGPTKEEVKHYI